MKRDSRRVCVCNQRRFLCRKKRVTQPTKVLKAQNTRKNTKRRLASPWSHRWQQRRQCRPDQTAVSPAPSLCGSPFCVHTHTHTPTHQPCHQPTVSKRDRTMQCHRLVSTPGVNPARALTRRLNGHTHSQHAYLCV